jgi:uncharacterized protein (DUF1778 family)
MLYNVRTQRYIVRATMKHERIFIRIETAAKTHLERAAKQKFQSLTQFVIQAALEKSEMMRAAGWRVKAAPKVGDARRKPVKRAAA